MNEIVAAAKGCGGKGYGYARMKAEWTGKVKLHILAARVPKGIFSRVRIACRWIEPRNANGQERDPDNVEAGQKFLWDGMVDAGIIPNDRSANNAGSSHEHCSGPAPGVEVTIMDGST
jgi:hypothetical protein